MTGRVIDTSDQKWLEAPVGPTAGIGKNFYDLLAESSGLVAKRDVPSAGLIADFNQLASPTFKPDQVHTSVAAFYEHTADYDLDAWSEWRFPFRLFGKLLARFFSLRLQQLNVPLSPLDTSDGITSEVVQLIDPGSGEVRHTAWIRQLVGSGNVLYAGSYSLTALPGEEGVFVKVAFPLPNGNALVIMRPKAHPDGSFSVTSAGKRFGDAGFYFTIRTARDRLTARYVRALTESIQVFPAERGRLRAEHKLWFWGIPFLQLHYRMSKQASRTPELHEEKGPDVKV